MNVSDIASILYTIAVILYTVVSMKRITLLENQNRVLLGNLEAVTALCKNLFEEKEKAEEQSEANGKAE